MRLFELTRRSHLISAIIVVATLLPLLSCGSEMQPEPPAKEEGSAMKGPIVTVGGTVTEIVYALGAGDRVVAVDVSSTHPEEARKLPQVGYQRTLAAENILSLNPSLVLASEEAGPPVAIEQLKGAGVKVVMVPAGHTLEGVKEKIRLIAEATGQVDEGRVMIEVLEGEMKEDPPAVPAMKVMFLYARGPGSLQVSGKGTAADAIIAMAGGRNAVTEYEGYKPLTPEAAIAAAPDVILAPQRSLDQAGGIDALLKAPGIAETPAGKGRRVIGMDDLYLLGFGPRLPQVRKDLAFAFRKALSEQAK
jgi:iron complex transport system substrate-binding protein